MCPFSTLTHDYGKLYSANILCVDTESVYVTNDETAYDLPKEGKYLEGYSFFNKYKNSIVIMPDALHYGSTKGNPIEEIRGDNEYIKIVRHKRPPLPPRGSLLLRHITAATKCKLAD